MMIGPAGGGKSEATWCLLDSLSAVKKKKHVEVRMNRKAMKADEMFGDNDTVHVWSFSVFTFFFQQVCFVV